MPTLLCTTTRRRVYGPTPGPAAEPSRRRARSSRSAQAHDPAEQWAARPGATARTFPSEQLIRLICRALPAPRRAGLSVLDVGCGNGRNSLALAQLGFGDVIAVDPSAELVELCRAAAERAGQRLDARVGGLPTLPCDDESVDVAVAWGVLYVLDGRDALRDALRDLARVLRPGGLLIADWRADDDHLRSFAGATVDERTVVLRDDAPLNLTGATYSFWDRAGVEDVLAAAGFAIVDMQREEIRETLTGCAYAWWQTCARASAH